MQLKKLVLIGILLLGFVTRFLPYPTQPTDSTAWDEAYFIPQTESYIMGRYFFDPHPPFARMFMVWGTLMFNPDAKKKIDVNELVDHKDGYKSKLNLEGVRFFPKLFGSLVPALVFLVMLELLFFIYKKYSDMHIFYALFTSSMALFENTFILESRIAVMTQILLCMMLATVYAVLRYVNIKKTTTIIQLCMPITIGTLFAGAFGTKWLAASLIPFIVGFIFYKYFQGKQFQLSLIKKAMTDIITIFSVAFICYTLLYVWHFSQFHYYTEKADEAGEKYANDLKNGTHNTSFVEKFITAYKLKLKYEENVPVLDYAKDDENGSYWINWPIMARTISYFWTTPGNGTYAFAYLIGNPVIWLLGFIGVISLSSIIISKLITGNGSMHTADILLLVFYYANWLPFAFIERVMYLYHYIPALMVSMLLFVRTLEGYIIPRITNKFDAQMGQFTTMSTVTLLSLFIFIGYVMYAPFTYVTHITKKQFDKRYILKDWHMKWPGN